MRPITFRKDFRPYPTARGEGIPIKLPGSEGSLPEPEWMKNLDFDFGNDHPLLPAAHARLLTVYRTCEAYAKTRGKAIRLEILPACDSCAVSLESGVAWTIESEEWALLDTVRPHIERAFFFAGDQSGTVRFEIGYFAGARGEQSGKA